MSSKIKFKLVAIVGLMIYGLASMPSTLAIFTAQARADNNRFTTALVFGTPSPSPTPSSSPSPTPSPTSAPTTTPVPSGGNVIIVSGNGDGSTNTVNIEQNNTTTIIQNNNTQVITNVSSQANSGQNEANSNVTTGQSNSQVSVSVVTSSSSAQVSD